FGGRPSRSAVDRPAQEADATDPAEIPPGRSLGIGDDSPPLLSRVAGAAHFRVLSLVALCCLHVVIMRSDGVRQIGEHYGVSDRSAPMLRAQASAATSTS